MYKKNLRLFLVCSLFFSPSFVDAGRHGQQGGGSAAAGEHLSKSAKHKHRRHARRAAAAVAATLEESGTASHDEVSADDDTLKLAEERAHALAAVQAVEEKMHQHEISKKAKRRTRREKLDAGGSEEDLEAQLAKLQAKIAEQKKEASAAEEDEPEESGFVHFVKSPEFREGAKKTAGCCAGFGLKIFRNIKKEQEKLKEGEKLDAGAIIGAIIEAAAASLESENLLETDTPRSKRAARATRSRRMVTNPNRGGHNPEEKHAVTLTVSQFDDRGDEIDVHSHVYKVRDEEEEIAAALAIYNATLDTIAGEDDVREDVELDLRRGRAVRGSRGVPRLNIPSKPQIKIAVHYTNGGKKYMKTCMISTGGAQAHANDVIDVDDEVDEAAYDPDAPLPLPSRKERTAAIADAQDDDDGSYALMPVAPKRSSGSRRGKAKRDMKKGKEKNGSRRSGDASTRD